MHARDILQFLKELKINLNGKKLLLIWDGLPAHRAKIIQEYTSRERGWLRLERFPAYAPELNPIEYLWSAMKRKDIANHVPDGFTTLKRTIRRSGRRLSDAHLLKGFLEASTLY